MQTSSAGRIADYNAKGWWENETLQGLFDEIIQDPPAMDALIDPANRTDLVYGPPIKLGFADMDAAVGRFCQWFYTSGLRQGDTLLIQLPNTVEIVLVYIAAAKIGLIISPVAVQYGTYELDFMRQVVKPKAYLAFRHFKGESFAAKHADVFKGHCQTLLLDETDFDFQKAPALSAECQAYMANLTQSPNDIFTICWTSGTTGRSKGVPRSHNHWLASAMACQDAMPLPPGSVFLSPFPFINMAAIGGFLYFWLRVKGTMVLHHPFDAQVFLKQLQDSQAVYTLAPPALLNMLLAQKEQIKAAYDLSNLRYIASGSAPLSPYMTKGFEKHFNIDVVNVYGSNEGAALISGPGEVPDAEERAIYFPRFGRSEFDWENRISTRIHTKLLDLETGEEITDTGQPGELCLTGATIFDGYFKSPDDNAQAFTKDGYFRSGDIFEIAGDKNQFYRFIGRCKALIIRGGVNISPEELDELLISHPDIAEAAVASYPDDIMGEKVCAFVVPLPGKTITLETITTYFEKKSVAKFKWPERLKILETLPRNPMNKVMRSALQNTLK